jgi:hypothetical protein
MAPDRTRATSSYQESLSAGLEGERLVIDTWQSTRRATTFTRDIA